MSSVDYCLPLVTQNVGTLSSTTNFNFLATGGNVPLYINTGEVLPLKTYEIRFKYTQLLSYKSVPKGRLTQHLGEDIRRKNISELSSWEKKKLMTIVTDQKKLNYMVLVWKVKIIGEKKSDLNLHVGRRNKNTYNKQTHKYYQYRQQCI